MAEALAFPFGFFHSGDWAIVQARIRLTCCFRVLGCIVPSFGSGPNWRFRCRISLGRILHVSLFTSRKTQSTGTLQSDQSNVWSRSGCKSSSLRHVWPHSFFLRGYQHDLCNKPKNIPLGLNVASIRAKIEQIAMDYGTRQQKC